MVGGGDTYILFQKNKTFFVVFQRNTGTRGGFIWISSNLEALKVKNLKVVLTRLVSREPSILKIIQESGLSIF